MDVHDGPWEFVLWRAIMSGYYNPEDDDGDDKSDEQYLEEVTTALANNANLSGVIPQHFQWNLHYNAPVKEGDSPLFASISLGKSTIAKKLIAAGAKARDAAEAREIVLKCESTVGAEILAYIFEYDALPSLVGGIEPYMLRVAGMYDNFTADFLRVCIEAAIAADVDLSEVLNRRGYQGRTMLHLAVSSYDGQNRCGACGVRKPRIRGGINRSKRVPVVQLLIKYGANITLTDNAGHTPLDLAKISDDPDPEVEDILIEAKTMQEKCEAFALGANSGSIMGRLDPEMLGMITRAACQ